MKCAFLTVAAAFACTFAAAPTSSAQTASLSFDDHDGPADAGTYPAGLTFTFSINLSFAPGGNVANLVGLSYFFEQQSPVSPFNFSITNRDVMGSPFSVLQTPGLTYPQSLAPTNTKDLGGATQSETGVGAGNYFVANLSVSISPSATPGTYMIENTTTVSGKHSVISDDQGHTFPIPRTAYTITVVPFAITSITALENQDVLLHCTGVPNKVNRIEASPDLSPNSFQTIGSVTPNSTGVFSFEADPGTQQFYRLAYP